MKIARRFTRRGHSPYGDLSFEPRVSEIRNPDGKVIFRQEGVIVPAPWSQIATDILAQKYFRKTGVPLEKGGTGGESDARQVFHRLAHTWMDWGRRHRYFDSEEDAQAFYDELCHMLAHQMAAPNSPQWFNTGLFAVYGIQGPAQGHYYADPQTGEVRKSESAYERPQPHACQPYQAAVSTPTGPVAIGSIVEHGLVGLEVFDGTDAGRGATRVVAVAESGVKPVFRVVLKNGSMLEATGDHLVLASERRREEPRWMRVDDLEPGVRLRQSTVCDVREHEDTDGRSTDEAALAGRYEQGTNRSLTTEVSALREEAVVRLEFAGLQPVYDIQTESGQYLSNNIVVHNCFILSVEDDLVNEGGIMDLVTNEARLFKYGSGTGSNFSRLRGRGEPLSGGGISSGLLSFLKVADRSASAIKSGGTTRRAAKMVALDADHPDIEEYVRWKVNEEQKVAAMAAGSRVLRRAADRLLAATVPQTVPGSSEDGTARGAADGEAPLEQRTDPTRNPRLAEAVREALDLGVPLPFVYKVLQLARQGIDRIDIPQLGTEWDEDAYGTVSGQSSNNSVRLSAAFMRAVLEDGDWALSGRIDPRVNRTVKARWLWDLIAYAAWNCADPGIQYHSTINEWHTCPNDGEIRASNPCSEYMFLDDTACNLASLNLLKFYDAGRRRFRLDDLRHAVHLWTVVLEISVLMAQFPSPRIARRSFDYRTLGLGYANLGSLLMVMGLPYDSEAGRAVAGALSAILTGQAYASSALLARELGPFARFAANREPMLRVIRNHRRAAHAAPAAEYEDLSVLPQPLLPAHCPPELLEAAREVWDEALRLGEAHGYRNAQVSAIAPTGTIGLLMDCDTTGVEPDYALVKFKKLAGGGFFKIINSSIPPALRNLGYGEEAIRAITAWCVGQRTLRGAPHLSVEELARRGFPQEVLARIDAAVRDAFLLPPLFTPGFLGREVLTGPLGIPAEEIDRPGFDLLTRLGLTREQVEEAERYACGTMSLEGAPHLKEEHYPVFDTASPTGRHGKRYIAWQAHIGMMAAVQPFVSGAVSKTINMPASATVEDVKGAHMLSWRKMLKAIALYRDGSKLSQPLSALSAGEEGLAQAILVLAGESKPAVGEAGTGAPGGAGTAGAAEDTRPGGAADAPAPTRRRKLPNRRRGYTQKVKIGEHSLFLRTGEYPDGSLGEIFLDMYREGAAFRSLLNSFAIAVSLGLQYGVPLEEYVDAFIFSRFEPNGIVHGHDHLKVTTSVLDLIFRDLALNYLRRTDLVQIKPDDLISTSTSDAQESSTDGFPGIDRPEDQPELPLFGNGDESTDAAGADPGSAGAAADATSPSAIPSAESRATSSSQGQPATARMQGYEGDPCPACGHLTLVRNGTCLKCMTCGGTTGCS